MQSHDSTLQALAQRVAKLEAQNRRFRKAVMAALVAASAAALMGQAQTSRTLEANEFVLKDNSGTVRARLSVDTTNGPILTFYRDRIHISASLAGGDEPSLTLFRAGTDEQVQLGANRTFNGLGLYEKEIRAGLSVQNGNPGLELYDESGKPRVAIEAAKNSDFIVLGGTRSNESGKPGVYLEASKDGDLILLGPTGSKESSAFTNSGFGMWGNTGRFGVDLGEEGPRIHLDDNEGYSTTLGRTDLVSPTSGRKERTPAASVVLFGKNQKVLWSAP
jgi:hypothetical protein